MVFYILLLKKNIIKKEKIDQNKIKLITSNKNNMRLKFF